MQHDLWIVSIGLNPSPISVKAGYYFANPRNRFWKALNASALVMEEIRPGKEAMQKLFRKYRIGFTDLVKRSSRMGNDLRTADYKQWAPVLKKNLITYEPAIAWFHGMGTYRNYLRYAEDIDRDTDWGVQEHQIGKTHVFVTPNPSPANARFSLNDLVEYYNELSEFSEKLKKTD